MSENVTNVEPPSPRPLGRSTTFLIGKDSHGNWVARDQRGLCGGLFISRADAIRFARFENGDNPQLVVMVPGILELVIGKTPIASSGQPASNRAMPLPQRAA